AGELDQHVLQVSLPEDQQVVEPLPTHGADPVFSDCVRAWRPIGQADDLNGLAADDVVEGGGEQDAIGMLPAWTAGLALEVAKLVREGENFSAEVRVGVASDDQDLEQETDGGV